jgi:hypothetical protein
VTDTLPANVEQRNDVSGDTVSGEGAGRSGLRSPRVATSVRRRKPRYNSGTWIDESHRRDRLSPVRERWERRATRLNREIADVGGDLGGGELGELAGLKRRRAYAVARVQKLTADIAPRLEACGVEGLPIACACGLIGARKTCRQWWLCGECREKRAPRLAADMRKGLEAALSDAVSEWGARGGGGMRPQIVLTTLTQEHSGNLVTDQAALSEGWRKLYKRLHEDDGAFSYVGVWEVTRGRDGLGHVHLHVAAIWRYRDWGRIREQWLRACPSSSYITFVAKRKDGKSSSPSSVAKYLAKYLAKGADLAAFDARLRAEVSAAFYNQRSVITSLYFWRRIVKCCAVCHERYRLLELEPLDPFDQIRPGVLVLDFTRTAAERIRTTDEYRDPISSM